MRLLPLLAMTVAVSLSGCAPSGPDTVLSLDEGTVQYTQEAPQEITLPDYWWPNRRLKHRTATYEFRLKLAEAPGELWAVYLPRLSMNAAAHVNGHFIGDGGRMTPPLSRNANRPLLFNVPTRMLRAGENVVQIELAVEPTFSGILDPAFLGPHAVLQSRFEARWMFQVLVPQVVAILSFAVALLILGVFVRADDEGANPWFAAALILWAIVLTQGFLLDPPLPARAWEFVGVASLASVVYCLTRAFHLRIFGQRLISRERVLLAVLGIPGLITALVPTRYAFTSWIVWQLITGTVAGYVLILVYHATKRGLITHPRMLAVATITGGLLAGHDLASVFWGAPISGFWLSGYAASVALLFTGWTILATMAHSLTEAETLNRELEGRVQQKHELLESNYQRLRVLERESAIAAERERIMQDVHDGIGGQLVSTLALVESGRGESAVVADSLHEALDDLRLIIDSLDPEEGDLAATLGTMRLRLQPRLERNGIQIDWEVQDVPPIRGFGPEQALQVLRVVQEAIANVLKHAGAKRVRIRTGTTEDAGQPEAYVEVEDDGTGMSEDVRLGRGLSNMRRRAATVGGRLEIGSGENGTRVRLRLPLA